MNPTSDSILEEMNSTSDSIPMNIDNPFLPVDNDDESDDESDDEDDEDKIRCSICFDTFLYNNMAWHCGECSLYICKNDFVRYCFSTHRNNMPGIPKCMSCDHQVSYAKMRQVLGPKLWNNWAEMKSLATIKGTRCYIPCPGINCPQWYWNADYNINRLICKETCLDCKTKFCVRCFEIWTSDSHIKTCKKKRIGSMDVKIWMQNKETDAAKLSKSCPTCSMTIEHDGGCFRVTCTHCGSDICWSCSYIKCQCCRKCSKFPCICCKQCRYLNCKCCPDCEVFPCICCAVCDNVVPKCGCCQRCKNSKDNCSCPCRRCGLDPCKCCTECNAVYHRDCGTTHCDC